MSDSLNRELTLLKERNEARELVYDYMELSDIIARTPAGGVTEEMRTAGVLLRVQMRQAIARWRSGGWEPKEPW